MKIVIAATLSYVFNKLYLKIDEYIKKTLKNIGVGILSIVKY